MEPQTKKERLLPRSGADGFRWQYQTERDERLFHEGWFADFRSRWQDDLKREHLNFVAKLEGI